MDSLNNLFESLKERAKAIWAEQMESELVIRLKERFEELPPLGQRAVIFSALGLLLVIIFWWPVSNLMDASDLSQRFEDRRQVLKELLQIQREAASGNVVPVSPPPQNLKGQFDQKIAMAGVQVEQIKESGEVPTRSVGGAQEQGYQYRIEHLTVRQAVDLGFELEHVDPSLRLIGLDVIGNDPDPHFYEVHFKVANYAAKMAEAAGGGPGSAILDAAKKEREKASDKPSGGDGGKNTK